MNNRNEPADDPPSPYAKFGVHCDRLVFANQKNIEFQDFSDRCWNVPPVTWIKSLHLASMEVQVCADLVAGTADVLSERGDRDLRADIIFLGELARTDLQQFAIEWKRKRSWFIANEFMPREPNAQFKTYASAVLDLLNEFIDERFDDLVSDKTQVAELLNGLENAVGSQLIESLQTDQFSNRAKAEEDELDEIVAKTMMTVQRLGIVEVMRELRRTTNHPVTLRDLDDILVDKSIVKPAEGRRSHKNTRDAMNAFEKDLQGTGWTSQPIQGTAKYRLVRISEQVPRKIK